MENRPKQGIPGMKCFFGPLIISKSWPADLADCAEYVIAKFFIENVPQIYVRVIFQRITFSAASRSARSARNEIYLNRLENFLNFPERFIVFHQVLALLAVYNV